MLVVAALGLLTSCADVPSVEWYYQDCDADGVPNLGAYDESGNWVEAEKGQFQVPDECQDEADRESCWNSKWKQTDSNLDDCRGAISVDAVETTRSNHAQFDQELDDCDDHDANIRPAYDDSSAGDDVPCDAIDQDCDGLDTQNAYYPDSDRDGYGAEGDPESGCADDFDSESVQYVTSTGDCDDDDPDKHPQAWEPCGSGDTADDVDCEAGFQACALDFGSAWSTDGATVAYLGTQAEDLTPDDGDTTTTEVAYAAIGPSSGSSIKIIRAAKNGPESSDYDPDSESSDTIRLLGAAPREGSDGNLSSFALAVNEATAGSGSTTMSVSLCSYSAGGGGTGGSGACSTSETELSIAGGSAWATDSWYVVGELYHKDTAGSTTTTYYSAELYRCTSELKDCESVTPTDSWLADTPDAKGYHDYTTWPVSLLSLDVCGSDDVEELLVGVGGASPGQVSAYNYNTTDATLTEQMRYTDDIDATAFGAALMALPNGEFAVSATYPGSTGNPGEVYFIEDPVCNTDDKDLGTPELSGKTAGDEFGYAMSMIGDISGDGTDDFAVGAPGADQVYVFLGPVDAINSTDDATDVITGTAGTRFGHAISPAGDMNLDGYDDLFVAAPAENKVYLIYGGP